MNWTRLSATCRCLISTACCTERILRREMMVMGEEYTFFLKLERWCTVVFKVWTAWSVLWFIGMHCGLQSCNLLNFYFPPFTWSLFHVSFLSRVKINSTKLASFQCIDLFHNCGLWIYSFICLIICLSDLVSMCKIKNYYFQTIPGRLI